mmetsp:Transcript_15282/g.45323  ORF Transcript_15282/g.45323 Transcript_15282/m.45323 type:complete len:263 (-) Transcript_15282:610-1398(-)
MLLDTSHPSSVSARTLGATEGASPSDSAPSWSCSPSSTSMSASSSCGAGIAPALAAFFRGTGGGGIAAASVSPSSSAVGHVCSAVVGSYGLRRCSSKVSSGRKESTTRSGADTCMSALRSAATGQGSGNTAIRARAKSPWPVKCVKCLHESPGPRTYPRKQSTPSVEEYCTSWAKRYPRPLRQDISLGVKPPNARTKAFTSSSVPAWKSLASAPNSDTKYLWMNFLLSAAFLPEAAAGPSGPPCTAPTATGMPCALRAVSSL